MEDIDDETYNHEDLGFDFPQGSFSRRARYPYRQQDQFYYQNDVEEPLFFGGIPSRLIRSFRGSNTDGNYGIWTAIFIICLFQFRGLILSQLRYYREKYTGNWVVDGILDFCDYIRSYVHMTMDVLRNLRFLFTSSTGSLLEGNVDVTRTRSGGENGRNRRRRRFRDNSSSVMPELEDVSTERSPPESTTASSESGNVTSPNSDHDQKAKSTRPRIRRDEIEPAFLDEKDYPPGWLVYHPVLGVVPKTEADQYREEERLRDKSAMSPVMSAPAIKAS